ncbi:cytochrome P450 [Kibdelosporangium persicum]|uniref:Unspecific monooxygenase n=1 Tax=Kibdelosporangium persicum TaxID=2698649 RepID=A0ABX2FIH7_9PSEU|nr:cytochrome P450 [Kibdelosporangium persicum]NRN71092.1 Unspecific monooxygenase [Kibdelosporangium persicum]
MRIAEKVHYDPYDENVRADPYPVYARLRAAAPVYHNSQLDFWAVSRHADVTAFLLDGDRFSNANGNSIEPASWGPNAYKYASVLAMDPPMHTRVRSAVTTFFGSRRIASLEPAVGRMVRDLLDEVPDRFDFVADFVDRFPMRVLCLLIGVPENDHGLIQELADKVVERENGTHDAPIAAIEATLALMEYFGGLIEIRGRAPADDLVSHLLAISGPGQKVSPEEIVGFLNLLTAAGNDTVIQLLGNAWYWAWRHPSQRELAFAGNISGWVEETLRFDTPNQFAARMAVVDIERHGVVIPAGAKVLMLPGSANRDPDVFADPDRYDVTRLSPAKVTFGTGRHRCLGVRLARLQARVALRELVSRFSDYDIDTSGLRRVAAAEARGFLHLPTAVTRR